MTFLSVALIGVGLSMDACAVSLSCGIIFAHTKYRHAVKAAAFFGSFQALMPLAGYYAGRAVYGYLIHAANWLAFALLVLIGGHMIYAALRRDEQRPADLSRTFSTRSLLTLAVVTSIDALAVGVSFALMNVNIWLSIATIGGITFVLSFFSVLLGKRVGRLFRKKAELLGGLILVLIGLEILADAVR